MNLAMTFPSFDNRICKLQGTLFFYRTEFASKKELGDWGGRQSHLWDQSRSPCSLGSCRPVHGAEGTQQKDLGALDGQRPNNKCVITHVNNKPPLASVALVLLQAYQARAEQVCLSTLRSIVPMHIEHEFSRSLQQTINNSLPNYFYGKMRNGEKWRWQDPSVLIRVIDSY